MSEDSFFGRTIEPGRNSLNFDLCEICERKFPNWVETKFVNNVAEIQLTCNDCHVQHYENPIAEDVNAVRQMDEKEELVEATRPAWVEEFVEEQKASGTIETIATNENEGLEEEEVIEEFEGGSTSEILTAVAGWNADFIKQSLFGADMTKWLDDQDAFSNENMDLTLQTLSSYSSNQINQVKVASLNILKFIISKHASFKDKASSIVQSYLDDLDESIVNLAQELLS